MVVVVVVVNDPEWVVPACVGERNLAGGCWGDGQVPPRVVRLYSYCTRTAHGANQWRCRPREKPPSPHRTYSVHYSTVDVQ